jgi:hypothetical protein
LTGVETTSRRVATATAKVVATTLDAVFIGHAGAGFTLTVTGTVFTAQQEWITTPLAGITSDAVAAIRGADGPRHTIDAATDSADVFTGKFALIGRAFAILMTDGPVRQPFVTLRAAHGTGDQEQASPCQVETTSGSRLPPEVLIWPSFWRRSEPQHEDSLKRLALGF